MQMTPVHYIQLSADEDRQLTLRGSILALQMTKTRELTFRGSNADKCEEKGS
jgi:hypothetical protein